MILALGFFLNGTLNRTDYREFIRSNSLSQEHLVSAKHFLQREFLFPDDIEKELMKWYSEIATHVMNTVQDGHSFENRHGFLYDPKSNNSQVFDGPTYLLFMKNVVLPRIEEFQRSIRADIRFELIDLLWAAFYKFSN